MKRQVLRGCLVECCRELTGGWESLRKCQCGALWETRLRFVHTLGKYCNDPVHRLCTKTMYLSAENMRGTTGEILGTPSIEHSGLRGDNRFLHDVRQQHSVLQLFSSCVWQTSA